MDTKTQILIIIISSLISGIIGVIISIIYHRKYEQHKIKIDTLKNFVAYRYNTKSVEFMKTINEIFIVFRNSKEVINTLNKLHEYISTNQKDLASDYLVKLFKAMCRDLKININKFADDSIFIRTFDIKE
ncbi:hypothetical protein KKH07_00605 [Patescibacteria group bacterium]|nr:hypothetical protein [Patescibacteria group bacterium]MBU1563593.1 hypothetical protein [Patescibacteria group bacterium]MBU2068487.1 hypothetical protein [Patescibacteria group bacterium]